MNCHRSKAHGTGVKTIRHITGYKQLRRQLVGFHQEVAVLILQVRKFTIITNQVKIHKNSKCNLCESTSRCNLREIIPGLNVEK